MKSRIRLICSLIVVMCMLAACAPQGTDTVPSEPTHTALPAPTEPAAGETAPPEPTDTALPEPTEPAAGETVKLEANRDGVFTLAVGGERQALPSPEQTFLEVGQGVGVDTTGRAILRFADLLTVEVLRDGELKVQELAINEQSAVVTVLQNGGALINDFNPTEEIDRRFTIQTEFATITATGTRFVVDREANSPLEWVVGLDAKEGDLSVTADGVTKPVPTGTARWIAPIGAPSPGISADMPNLQSWIDKMQDGLPVRELGEVVFPQADIVANTQSLAELPEPGQPFELAEVELVLDPQGLFGSPTYRLEDCNGDGIPDIAIEAGKLHMDFRTVLARVRALDVTVINRAEPGSGSLRVLDPSRSEIGAQQVKVGSSEGQILSLRADQPYHYAELAMSNGCFLGFSLTPPDPDGEPGAPRPAVENWQEEAAAGAPTVGIERPPENGRLQAPPVGTNGYSAVIEMDGALDDWDALAQLSGVDWTGFGTVVYDTACANRHPAPTTGGYTDLGGWVRFAYDETYLYVAFLVDDDGYVGYSGNDQRYFLGDAPQLSLDMNLTGDFSESTLSQDDLQVDFHPGFEAPYAPYPARVALWQLDTLRSREFSEARVATMPTDTGYFLETALPWKYLNFGPQPGASLGVAASVSDNDTPGTDVQECMISTAPQRDWKNPTTWGTLLLSPASEGQ